MMWKTGTQLWKVFCIVTILAVCMQGFSPVRPAQAATCTVTSAADSGEGTLRALLADTTCDTIEFSGDMVIPLASTLWVDRDVTIDGTPHKVVISGENQVRVFIITYASAILDHLTITKGADQPIEIYNRWEAGAGYYINVADGAGILNVNSNLMVRGSTISNNRADNPGSNGGGIANYDGTVELINSTVANNTARVAGGGIFNHSTRVKLRHSTVAWNHTYEGKGNAIAQNNYGSSSTSQYEFYNTLLMNNDAVEPIYGSAPCDNIDDPLFFVDQASANGSWADDSYCPPLAIEFDTDLIGPLGDYGGDTETVPLLPGNPIINTGDYTLCYTGDQRGQPRPYMECDPGAFESQGFVLSDLTGTPQTTYVNTAFAEPLGLTIIANNPLEPVIGGKIKFTAPSYPGAILRQGYPGWWPSIITINSATISQPVFADGVAGTYNVVAAASGALSVAFRLTNIYYEDVAYPCTVTSAADSGAGTLRELLDTFLCYPINFDGDYEIRLSSPLEINRKAIVDGGEHRIVINGDSDLDGVGDTQLFKLYSGANATLQNLTLTNGLGVDGGAIQNGGTLTVKDSTFTANRAEGTDAGSGGAIHNTGYLTVTGSTFSANSAWGRGGAMYSDQGSLTLTNNTFSGNSVDWEYGWGGAVASFSSATINNNTFVGNQAVIGGAVSSSYYPQDIYNNILVKGSTGENCYYWQTTPIIAGSNLADDDSCGTGFTNLSTLSTGMNALGSYGGPTQTFQLLPGSPAIDAADSSQCPATDQRGVTRPQGTACDVGAYEFQETTIPSDYVISGVVYDDLNGNGSRDAGELGIENAPVYILLNIDQTPFSSLTAETSADGSFQFTLTPPDGGLPAGFSVSVYVEPLSPGVEITQLPAPFAALTGNLTGMDIGIHWIVLVHTPASFPDGVQGVPYAQTMTVTGGDTPYTFTPTSSWSVPAGVSAAFDPQAGTITLSGTPTETGTFYTHVDVTTASGLLYQIWEDFSINPPMQFDPLSLPDGSLNTAYNQTITVSGGMPPYTFTTGSEQWLPAGLALDTGSGNIVVAGTPAEAGQVTLDVYVSDQAGATVEVQRAFWIKTVPSLTLTSSLNPSSEGQEVTFSLGSSATVANWPAPWGKVTFKVDGAAIPGCVDVWLEYNPEAEEPAPNPVTCTISSLAAGSHEITAELPALFGPYTDGTATLPGGQTVNADEPVYQSGGFSAPVDLGGVFNTAKAGQMIPLKWRLLDAAGDPVTNLDPASVVLNVSAYACQAGIPTDQIETYTSGTTLLQNLGDGYYQLNWKTEKSYANTCKQITLKMGTWSGDGFTALFKFNK